MWRSQTIQILISVTSFSVCLLFAGNIVRNIQKRFKSGSVGNFAYKARTVEGASEASLIKRSNRSDPEGVIRLFEGQPQLHSNPSAVAEYVRALIKVDRLDECLLLKTLQRGEQFGLLLCANISARQLWFQQHFFVHSLYVKETSSLKKYSTWCWQYHLKERQTMMPFLCVHLMQGYNFINMFMA